VSLGNRRTGERKEGGGFLDLGASDGEKVEEALRNGCCFGGTAVKGKPSKRKKKKTSKNLRKTRCTGKGGSGGRVGKGHL